MIVSQSNLQLLLSDNILLGPVCIVFLDDLTRLDDALQFFDHQWPNPHCQSVSHEVINSSHVLSLRMRLSLR